FHALSQFAVFFSRRCQRKVEAIEHRKEQCCSVGNGILPKIGLLARCTLAIIVELSLRPRKALEKRVALCFELLIGFVALFRRRMRLLDEMRLLLSRPIFYLYFFIWIKHMNHSLRVVSNVLIRCDTIL